MRSVIVLTVAVLSAVAALGLVQEATWQATLWAGGVLVLVGVGLVGLARRQLGDAFAIAPRAKGLVTGGLYARIPHPMYVFLDVALLGLVIMLREGWLLVVWGAIVLVQAWQARRETKVLQRAFGPAYLEYRRRTWW